jgi:uncharacterized membrane protein YhaH (DUF805 family)
MAVKYAVKPTPWLAPTKRQTASIAEVVSNLLLSGARTRTIPPLFKESAAMTYQEAYLKMVNNYFGFEGRANLGEYWKPFLVNLIISVVLGVLELAVHPFVYLADIFFLAILFPGLALLFRRLHDTGRSGWWWLIGIIPVLGWLALIYLAAQPGDPASNSFGAPSV